MVYCGKPSKSCSQCRKRDIKCDKRSPSCGQCIRATHTCPGYRSSTTLVFRDETRAVIFRSWYKGLPPVHVNVASTVLSESRELENHAKSLFIEKYVLGPDTMYYYMCSLFSPKLENSCLTAAVRAVALAHLSSTLGHSDQRILDHARLRYGNALQMVITAVRDPVQVKENYTLQAVILMDQFEKFTSTSPASTSSISSRHLTGALALLRLSGAKVKDETRAAMFRHLSLEVLAGIGNEKEMLKELFELHRKVRKTGWGWKVEDVVMRFFMLRSAKDKGKMSDEMAQDLRGLENILEQRRIARAYV